LLDRDTLSTLDKELSTFEGTLDSVAAHLVVTECYDEYFGIYENSSQGRSPFALAALHEPEDLSAVDPFDTYLERYLAANVLKFTGIDYVTFMTLPRDRAEAILKRCDSISMKEDASVGQLMDQVGIK